MAWYQINYSCGHTGRTQLYGKNSDRERRIEWMERGICPDCYRAQKEAEKNRENERAANLANELGFSDLSGSEKQIAWAKSIRQKLYEKITASYIPHPAYGYGLLVEAISLERDAKWWIDHRDTDALRTMNIIAGNYPAQTKEINKKLKEAR